MPISIAISMGDPLGVGPEVILKALCSKEIAGRVIPIVVGLPSVMRKAAGMLRTGVQIRTLSADRLRAVSETGVVYVLPPRALQDSKDAPRLRGLKVRDSADDALRSRARKAVDGLYETDNLPRAFEPLRTGGRRRVTTQASDLVLRGTIAAACVREAASLCLQGHALALVTAPLSKASLKAAGITQAGHTEMLRDFCGCKDTLMMFVRGNRKISLVTTHVAIGMIRKVLTRRRTERAIMLTHRGLGLLFGIPHPRLAILSLNPHKGEGGLLGCEEKTVIDPAIEFVSQKGVRAFGPFSADSFFSRGEWNKFDAVVAMYHDQGLIAAKLIGGERVTNLTLGLPFVRTSPGHGVAEDIAWKGVADPRGMISAILLAAKLARTVRLPLRWNRAV